MRSSLHAFWTWLRRRQVLRHDQAPEIPLAVERLAGCIAIRPGEFLEIREKDIDLARGYLFIPHPKEGRPKWVPPTRGDVERIRALKDTYPGFPEYFSGYTLSNSS